MNGRICLMLGSIFGFLSVAVGAFAAHGLKAKLSQEMFNIFEVGVRYHLYHALALLAVAWAVNIYGGHYFSMVGWFFVTGIVIFSGSLYILALTGVKTWGALTPIGGLFFLAGWFVFAFGAFKLPR